MTKKVLIIGSTGFIGSNLSVYLLARQYSVRCLSRSLQKAHALAKAGCEVVQGDILDQASLERAAQGIEAVYVSVQTITRRQTGARGMDFMEVEMTGLRHIVAAMRSNGVRRVVYVTTMGIAANTKDGWTRRRWEAEEYLLRNDLDATIIRPGEVIGLGGGGFDFHTSQSKRRIAFVPGNGQQKMRNIALADLLYYLEGVLDEPRTYRQRYAVGGEELLNYDQMIDLCAEVQNLPRPIKLHVPIGLLEWAAPLLERVLNYPSGGLKAGVQAMAGNYCDDASAIRALLPREPVGMREAVRQALKEKPSGV